MRKATLILISIISFAILVYFFWDRSNTYTFGEVVGEELAENESVHRVVITNQEIDSENFSQQVILEEDFFQRMVNETSHTELREKQGSPGVKYVIDIETNKDTRHSIYTNFEDLHMNGRNFEITGENYLVNFIESADLNWNE
ncbi:hypothetical protein [Alkalicoccus daliensis]|uniref:Uncharacterized protein n=1 Tax=Alkalicoccus daliensis TaxID=745820 RepID=A0A1H0D6M5_9BACI|nr:hypothetical protein [Alkalicoccus daliensis]SDN65656.1 hypothetical protein SAMN04488053_102358 [Alkalicoccus daliensis]